MTSFTLHGIPVSRGIAIGRAHILAPAALDVQHYLIADDQVEAEVARLRYAIATVHTELQTIWSELPKDAPAELGAFIDVHAGREGGLGLVHVDLYRVASDSELAELGLEELPGPDAVAAIEWPERLPAGALPRARVRMEDLGGDRRRIDIALSPA